LLQESLVADTPTGLTPPRKILVATDLSARSDRALDRAKQLAAQWGAGLVVVHAMERQPSGGLTSSYENTPSWRRPPDPARLKEQQIRRDIGETTLDLRIFVVQGDAGPVTLDVAGQEHCDLIVLGVAGDAGLGRSTLDRTVEYLVRRSPVSVLVVKTRPAGPYGHVLVGTDFTDEARHGLAVATRLFPDAIFAVMHAFDMPYRSLMSPSQLSRDFSAMEHAEIQAFVRDTDLDPNIRARILTLIEHGSPEQMIHKYVTEQNADLTVIGTRGRGMLFHLLVGGNTPMIVDGTPSDILVVRLPDEE
jgi:nucleotide-binding universal stress UspA family protein